VAVGVSDAFVVVVLDAAPAGVPLAPGLGLGERLAAMVVVISRHSPRRLCSTGPHSGADRCVAGDGKERVKRNRPTTVAATPTTRTTAKATAGERRGEATIGQRAMSGDASARP